VLVLVLVLIIFCESGDARIPSVTSSAEGAKE
jgi:hypothetical protein